MFDDVENGAGFWRYTSETAVKITKTGLQARYDSPATSSVRLVLTFLPTLCYFSGAKHPIFEP
jgi:hypothetical protein